MFHKINAYFELTKPRILALILVTTTIGYYLGGQGIQSVFDLIYLLIGAGCVCGGSQVLNEFIEREYDSKMERTKNRPIPAGIIDPAHALSFGIILTLFGLFVLYTQINLLTTFLSLLTSFLYIMVYTPIKRISWLNTSIGAIPGAIPPMGGWAAATNNLDAGAWILFLILFVWQHPHFYAIAWMLKEDYARGGFKMLPVVEPDGKKTFAQIIIFSIILIPISLLPSAIGMSGKIYFIGTLAAGIWLFFISRSVAKSRSYDDARKLLKATVFYLPVLLLLIVIDVRF